MKLKIIICILAIISTTLNAQNFKDSIKNMDNQIKHIREEIIQLEKQSKSLKYQFHKSEKENQKNLLEIFTKIDSIQLIINNLNTKLNSTNQDIENVKNKLVEIENNTSLKFEKSKKSSRFNIILSFSVLLLLLSVVGILLYLSYRKAWHELVELKREVDFEIKTTEKETISEIRGIKEELKKYTSPEALKHGPAYEELKESFIKEIQDSKDIFINRINELKEKYENESTYTKERIEKEVADFKRQIQNEIDALHTKLGTHK